MDHGGVKKILERRKKWNWEASVLERLYICGHIYMYRASSIVMAGSQWEKAPERYHVLCVVTQLCLTLCSPMSYSAPGYSVHGDSPGKNTGVGCHFLPQGIFPTQGSNPGLPHCRQILYQLSHKGSHGGVWATGEIPWSLINKKKKLIDMWITLTRTFPTP